MNTNNPYDYEEEAELEHFYRLAVQASVEQTQEASQEAYKAMVDVQHLLVAYDDARFSEVLATLPNHFLDLYVEGLIVEIDFIPIEYLINHSNILGLLTEEQYAYAKHQVKVKGAYAPAAYDFICGIEFLTQGSAELALPYFTKIDSALGEYFSGMCYYHLKNYENAKRLLQDLLESLFILQEEEEVEFLTHDGYGLLLHDVSLYALSANVLLKAYKEAERVAHRLLQEFSLRDLVDISEINPKDREGLTDFEVFVTHYTTALVKLGKYKEAQELLNESIRLNPSAGPVKSRLLNTADQLDRQRTADSILAPLLHKENAYGLKEFLKGNRFAREEKLDDLIALQINAGMPVFGKRLEIYQDEYGYGRQYAVPHVTGFIDLLLIDRATAVLYVVALKPNTAGVDVYDEIKRYMQGLEQRTDKPVQGIICLRQPKEALIAKVKEDDSIELFTYHVAFNKLG